MPGASYIIHTRLPSQTGIRIRQRQGGKYIFSFLFNKKQHLIQQGITLEDIHRELASRHVIDHKVKQEKMTK